MERKIILKNDKVNKILESKLVERLFFSLFCATIISTEICHWMLDFNYKFENLSQAGPIIDFKFVLWISVIVSIYYLLKRGKIVWDAALIILIQVMLLVGVLDYHSQNYVEIPYAFLLPLAYIVAKSVVIEDKGNSSKKAVLVFAVIAIGMYIQSIIDFLYVLSDEWFTELDVWINYWTKTIQPRTTYEYGFVFVTSAAVLLFLPINKYFKALILVLNIVSQYFVIKTEGRENTCMLLIALMIGVIAFICELYGKKKKQAQMLILILVFGIIVGGVIVWPKINNYIQNSYWSDGGGILHNQRIQTFIDAIKYQLQFPLENYTEKYGLPYSHAMLLEYGRVYDFSIMLLLVIFIIITIKDTIVLLISKRVSKIAKWLFLTAFININAYYLLEPNAHAHRYFWMPGLMLFGIIRGLTESLKYEKTNISTNVDLQWARAFTGANK